MNDTMASRFADRIIRFFVISSADTRPSTRGKQGSGTAAQQTRRWCICIRGTQGVNDGAEDAIVSGVRRLCAALDLHQDFEFRQTSIAPSISARGAQPNLGWSFRINTGLPLSNPLSQVSPLHPSSLFTPTRLNDDVRQEIRPCCYPRRLGLCPGSHHHPDRH